MRAAHVLVVGAGPTGLTLALQAHDHGARVRIVERRREAFRPSRALILHPRTLEALRPLGVTEPLLARADIAPQACLHLGSRVVRARLAELALSDTAFPHLSLVRQMDVEAALAQALAERGIEVERGVELIEVSDGKASACAVLRSLNGLEHAEYDFVVGCDGPDSAVRRAAGIRWRGGSYAQEVVLADLELDADLAPGVAHVVAGRQGLLFLFALGESATWRLLATRPAAPGPLPFGQPGPPVPSTQLQALLDDAGIAAHITDRVWSAPYRLQYRLAARWRKGRLYLAGDAAHASSPATGQGMNTGIQDAINLGWKLAFAGAACDPATLLASYDFERWPVALQTLAMTHLAFWGEASTGRLPSLLRGVVAPLVAPAIPTLINQRRLVAEAIRWISQLRVAYPSSPLSVEGIPRLRTWPRVGRRLPDMAVTSGGKRVQLHSLLAHPGVHVLLHRDADDLERLSFGPRVTIHRLTNVPGTGMVAIRPDGYVGFRCQVADVDQLAAWLARIGAVNATPSPLTPTEWA
ncbi:MAG TPA: FAD-dependent monooxygenase [Ktedonobacterales bacterium]|nr:FAD-dependent monooxygenase [Ktedonobacterales bacterium]